MLLQTVTSQQLRKRRSLSCQLDFRLSSEQTCCGFVWASLALWIRPHVDPNRDKRRTYAVR